MPARRNIHVISIQSEKCKSRQMYKNLRKSLRNNFINKNITNALCVQSHSHRSIDY